jgi:hypothetical protein
LFGEYTGMTVNVQKCCITCALWSKGNALSQANRTLLDKRLQTQHVSVRGSPSPIPTITPLETYRVLVVELNTAITFNKH